MDGGRHGWRASLCHRWAGINHPHQILFPLSSCLTWVSRAGRRRSRPPPAAAGSARRSPSAPSWRHRPATRRLHCLSGPKACWAPRAISCNEWQWLKAGSGLRAMRPSTVTMWPCIARGRQQGFCLLAGDQIDDPSGFTAVGGLQLGQPVGIPIVRHPCTLAV